MDHPGPHPRRFRFGVEVQHPFDGMTWIETFRRIEELGYSTVFFPDHFDEGLGPVAAMATAVAVTSTLIVGPMVLACDFRHPAALARELATIDLFSGGRLEVGLGAGYRTDDYVRSGIPKDPPRVRVDRLVEYTAVLRGSFGTEPFIKLLVISPKGFAFWRDQGYDDGWRRATSSKYSPERRP